MGSFAHLTVSNYPVVESKNGVIPEVMTVFRERDRRVFERRVDQRNALVWGRVEPTDDVEEAVEYSCTASVAIDRLDVMGFGLGRARREYEEGRQMQLQEYEEWAEEGGANWFSDSWETLKKLSFDESLHHLSVVIRDGLGAHRVDDTTRSALDPSIKHILDADYDRPLGFLGGDIRLLLRIACSLVDPDANVVQDITDLVDGQFCGRDEPVCQNAIQDLTEGHPRMLRG